MSDDPLLDDLRRALDQAEPVPPDSTVMAEAAFGWRTIDAELAELVHDSTVDDGELVVRGSGDAQRVLTFTTPTVRIDVEFADGQLVGQIAPPDAASIEVRRSGDEVSRFTETDEFGAFVVDGVSRGPAVLLCRALDESWSVRTSWTNL